MNIRDKLLQAGVNNLKEFGYPGVTKENILTDMIYSAFFKGMLEGHTGPGQRTAEDLILEIGKNEGAHELQ